MPKPPEEEEEEEEAEEAEGLALRSGSPGWNGLAIAFEEEWGERMTWGFDR